MKVNCFLQINNEQVKFEIKNVIPLTLSVYIYVQNSDEKNQGTTKLKEEIFHVHG